MSLSVTPRPIMIARKKPELLLEMGLSDEGKHRSEGQQAV